MAICLPIYDHWSGRIVCKFGNRLPEDAVLGIGLVSLASAVMLIMVGSIPFIGVIIPNLVSRIYGDQVHKTIGVTALAGSLFLVFCDLVARVLIFPYEIPVSVIVGIIGGAIFLYLLIRGDDMLKKPSIFIGMLVLVLFVTGMYLTIHTYGNWHFAWALRSKKILHLSLSR